MSDSERLDRVEELYEQVDNQVEELAKLIDNNQRRQKKELTDLTEHLVHSFAPQIRKIVREELEKMNGSL